MGGGNRSEFSRLRRLLLYVTLTSGILSATGQRHDLPDADTTCGDRSRHQKFPLLPYLVALATSANMGSVATLVGQSAKHDNRTFLAHLVFRDSPVRSDFAAIVGLVIIFCILRLGFRKMLRERRGSSAQPVTKLDSGLFALVCVVFVSIFVGFLSGLNLAWTAMTGAGLLMVLARRDTHDVLKLVDWHLLVFFLHCLSWSMD